MVIWNNDLFKVSIKVCIKGNVKWSVKIFDQFDQITNVYNNQDYNRLWVDLFSIIVRIICASTWTKTIKSIQMQRININGKLQAKNRDTIYCRWVLHKYNNMHACMHNLLLALFFFRFRTINLKVKLCCWILAFDFTSCLIGYIIVYHHIQ